MNVQVWLGYQQSLRPSEKGLTLNVDVAATAFLEQQPVIEYMARIAGLRDVRELKSFGLGESARKVSKGMQGIKVGHHISGSTELSKSTKLSKRSPSKGLAIILHETAVDLSSSCQGQHT